MTEEAGAVSGPLGSVEDAIKKIGVALTEGFAPKALDFLNQENIEDFLDAAMLITAVMGDTESAKSIGMARLGHSNTKSGGMANIAKEYETLLKNRPEMISIYEDMMSETGLWSPDRASNLLSGEGIKIKASIDESSLSSEGISEAIGEVSIKAKINTDKLSSESISKDIGEVKIKAGIDSNNISSEKISKDIGEVKVKVNIDTADASS